MDRLALQHPEQESIDSLAEKIRKHVQPLERARGTRQKLETSWNSVVTWAAARDGLKLLLPMSESTLQALFWDAISLGCSHSVLKGLVHAVQARHGHFGLPKPVHGDGQYQRLIKSLSRFNGTQHRHVFPIHRDLVVKLLQYEPLEHGGGSCEGPGRGCRDRWRYLLERRNALC